MPRAEPWSRRRWVVLGLVLLAITAEARADRFELKDGRTLDGRMAKLTSLGELPTNDSEEKGPTPRLIVMVDDDLRRTSVPKTLIQEAKDVDVGANFERFTVKQRVPRIGGKVAQVGAISFVGPWDEWGRRTLTMNANGKVIAVIQGITVITPRWTKVEAVEQAGGNNLLWDMRIATSSIQPDTLRKILGHQINPKKIDDRLKLVRLFLQSARYDDCDRELQDVIRDFPANKDQFAVTLRDLRQQSARRMLAEIIVRDKAGQHQLAFKHLNAFPAVDVAGETLQAVSQLIEEYNGDRDLHAEILNRIDADVAALAARDSARGERLKPIVAEIKAELNVHSLDRMTPYHDSWDDDELDTEEKVALAVSGWLIGAKNALRKLPVAVSLFETRNLVRSYLTESVKENREKIFAALASQEGATPELVARLLEHMLPPLPAPAPVDGFFELEVTALPGDPPVKYYVQLPPEYDPHRRYPTIVTLRGAGTTPQLQIDWWAGLRDDNGRRQGQATRYGYIVIAPAWAKEGQAGYKFSAAEHAAVLNALRDACRRFSIDTDKVFLSGHSMGGDVAWDLGLAHPDLWAGVVPIVARTDRYIPRLWENARYQNFYFVGGELDADKSAANAKDIDRYMNRGYNATVVEFQGRGHEDFSDEILRLFDWMSRYERDFFAKDFRCHSMRAWDNYFWWLELDEFPPKTMVDPADWPPPRGSRTATTDAKVKSSSLSVNTGAGKATLWLSPQIVNFKKATTITVNGAKVKLDGGFVTPELKVMLEDARTRGDCRHPFWAKVEVPLGKTRVAEREKK